MNRHATTQLRTVTTLPSKPKYRPKARLPKAMTPPARPRKTLPLGVYRAGHGSAGRTERRRLVWYSTRNLESTDDAFVDGRAITIAPQVKGVVTDLAVTDNQFMRAGDVLLRIDPHDYVAARDLARGQLSLAQAQHRAALVNLDIVRSHRAAKASASAGAISFRRCGPVCRCVR